MIKRVFVFCLVALFFVPIVFAQVDSPIGEEFRNDEIVQGVQRLQETATNLSADELRAEYLEREWKSYLLNFKFVNSLDGFFRDINFLFVVFFGENYDLSFNFFTVFIYWLFFLHTFWTAFRGFLPVKKGSALLIAFGLAILVAQIGVLGSVAKFTSVTILARGTAWRWISIAFWFLILFTFSAVARMISQQQAASRRRMRERQQEADQDILHDTVENIVEASSD